MSSAAEAIRSALADQASRYIYGERIRAASLHLLGRGKLYRPQLALAAYSALGGPEVQLDQIVSLLTPLELIHTFTLIHDDLPCMDDAELRRGVSAVHLEFDEATAVLAGDALCVMAFQVLAAESGSLAAAQRLELVAALSEATQWVVAGQELDLAAEGAELSVEKLVELQQRKTGALLGACCEFGGILAGQGRRTDLRELGWRLGLLFQIRDDLLSAESTEAQVGKTLATDLQKGKSTLVRALGVQGATALAEQTLDTIRHDLAQMPGMRAPELLAAHAELAWHRER